MSDYLAHNLKISGQSLPKNTHESATISAMFSANKRSENTIANVTGKTERGVKTEKGYIVEQKDRARKGRESEREREGELGVSLPSVGFKGGIILRVVSLQKLCTVVATRSWTRTRGRES